MEKPKKEKEKIKHLIVTYPTLKLLVMKNKSFASISPARESLSHCKNNYRKKNQSGVILHFRQQQSRKEKKGWRERNYSGKFENLS